jgi:quercetin dioxygenase-like cupin family protein
MKRYAVSEPSSGDAVRVLFDLPARRQAALRVGSVRLAPGERVPPVGLSQHLADEVALLVSGSLYGESAGVPFAVSAGEVTHIPAGEPHWAVAGDGGAEVFWLWFGTMEGENGSTDRAQ